MSRLALLAFVAAAGPVAEASLFDTWFKQQVLDRVSLAGYRRLSYHSHTVSGDEEAFSTGNYGGQGDRRFTDFGTVNVNGRKVLGAVNFDFNIQDSRFSDPQGDHFSIDWARGPWTLNLGDVRGSLLNTNRFASFSKTLRGAQVGFRSKGFAFKAVRSEVRGSAKTVSMSGTNSPGPYYLQSSQVIRGSEQVTVDGVAQELGRDYVVNYEIGTITFVNRDTMSSRAIPPTSTIVVTYEALGYGGQTGRVEGAGASLDMGRAGRVGLTAMRQVLGGGGQASTRLESFQGYGPPSTPYFLQLEPLRTQPIVVRVDGVLQIEGVDYYFDSQNPVIFYFKRFMPSTCNIDVLYTPKPVNTVDGDREVVGVDYTLPVAIRGGRGSVRLSQATGRLTNTPTPTSGSARGAEFRMQWPKATLNAGYRDVPEGYVSVETTGFNRNERVFDIGLQADPTKDLRWGVSHSNSSIAVRSTSGTGVVTYTPTRYSSVQANLQSLGLSSGLPWSLSQTRTLGRNAGGETRVDSTNLTTSRTLGRLSTRLSLGRQDARGPGATTGDTPRSVRLDTLNLGGSYSAGHAWNFSFSQGISAVSADGESGTGRDLTLGATYSPSDKLTASLSLIDSDSGALATLGSFNTGYGAGYGGNGFSGGADYAQASTATDTRQAAFRLELRPSPRLRWGGGASVTRTTGSSSSNTETQSVSTDLDFDMGGSNSLTASLSGSRTRFIDSPSTSEATTLNLFWDGSPAGPWSYRLGTNWMLASGGEFGQNSRGYEATLSYLLSQRHSLSLSYVSGGTRGYLPQDDSDVSLTYQYRIWRGLAFNLSYRVHDVANRDPSVTTGAYTSRGFDAELAFNFGM